MRVHRAAPFDDQTRNAPNEKNPKIKKYFPRYSLRNADSKNRAAQKNDHYPLPISHLRL
jgi:hypothetical protein